MDSGLKSLVLTSRQKGVELSLERLHHDYALGEEEPDSNLLVKIAMENGLKARLVSFNWQDLTRLGPAFPAIARLKNGNYVIVVGYKPGSEDDDQGEHVLVVDPLIPKSQIEPVAMNPFLEHWDGTLILLKKEFKLTDEERPFSYGWVFGQFLKQKMLLGQLFFVAIVLHFFAVVPVIFIMIVLDKVVNYQSQSTLYVIAGGVLVAYIFNGIFGYLRQYLILFATSKVDVRANSQVFSKLLNLPLSFFQKRSIPDLIKTVQQTNTLRQVLTGKFFAAILDSTALVIFIPILFMYSPLLCAVVFVFAALISANVAIASRVQKDKMKSAAAADSEKQLVLMNSVSGIETVKSLALEPVQKHEWQDAAAHQIIANLELGKANAVTSQISSTLQQMMTVAVIFIGVQLVFSGELSAGVLIGANMLAGRITGPLVQLVSLAMDMEKVSIAVKMLASVMNTRGESGRRGLVPDILGGIEFKDVSFTYEDETKALDGVTFSIPPRQKIGLVGRSGAGKTTIARHIQGTLRPDEGTITVDGEDLRSVDLGHLRMNIAVVNQDACLFKGSIRSNILKPSPGSTMAQVLWASKMVGLHEDIESLADGYETILEESGANLSECLCKKIAIARALIRNPRILVLDEPFASFDVESEIMIKDRLSEIGRGRTLIIISSRISHVMDCDQILVMEQGKVVQTGIHNELVATGGVYKERWRMEETLMGPAYSPTP